MCLGYVRSIMQRRYPQLKYDDTSAWRMTKDECGVVVDVNCERVHVDETDGSISIMNIKWEDGQGVTLEVAKEVPELQEFANNSFGGGYGGGGGGGGGGRGGRGGYGGRGGGYGGGYGGGKFAGRGK
jgi:ATP-dependent RNA helicase DDX21